MDIVELKGLVRNFIQLKTGRNVLFPIRKTRGEDNKVETKLTIEDEDKTFKVYGVYIEEYDSIQLYYMSNFMGGWKEIFGVEKVDTIKQWIKDGVTHEDLSEKLISLKDLCENLKAGKVTINLNGHNKNHPAYIGRATKDILRHYGHLCDGANGEFFKDDDDEDKKARMKDMYKMQLEHTLKAGENIMSLGGSDGLYCFECGSRTPYILQDINTITVGSDYNEKNKGKPHSEGCKFKDDVPYGKGQIEIKSKMILANFFHAEDEEGETIPELSDTPEGMEYTTEYDLNSTGGRLAITEHKAKNNIAYGQMGNMSVGVWVNKDKTKVIIADPYWEDTYYDSFWNPDTNSYPPEEEIPEPPIKKYIEDNGLKHVGNISLSVWRWEATDFDYIKQFKPNLLGDEYHDKHIIDVKKGKWDFVHYFDVKSSQNPKEVYKDTKGWEVYAELNYAE